VEQSLFSLKVSRLSTQKKALPMSLSVARIAVVQESNSATATVDTVTTTDGNHLNATLVTQSK
jgi:hypothetical protein